MVSVSSSGKENGVRGLVRRGMGILVRVCLLISGIIIAGIPTVYAQQYTLYVQEGCTHCAKVEAFIEENGLEEEFAIRDVLIDTEAGEEYTAFLDEEAVPLQQRGVPLMVYDGGQWLSGGVPIIDFLRERHGIEEPEDPVGSDDILLLGGGAIIIAAIVGYGVVNSLHGKKRS
ncbi:MAG: glutaredoxin domain-containing protein [Candidatus Dojkabacteria bacterium]|nr:glutaredoxin domain-containing protein [Candidatus Dojkabacteria bacterium]